MGRVLFRVKFCQLRIIMLIGDIKTSSEKALPRLIGFWTSTKSGTNVSHIGKETLELGRKIEFTLFPTSFLS